MLDGIIVGSQLHVYYPSVALRPTETHIKRVCGYLFFRGGGVLSGACTALKKRNTLCYTKASSACKQASLEYVPFHQRDYIFS